METLFVVCVPFYGSRASVKVLADDAKRQIEAMGYLTHVQELPVEGVKNAKLSKA